MNPTPLMPPGRRTRFRIPAGLALPCLAGGLAVCVVAAVAEQAPSVPTPGPVAGAELFTHPGIHRLAITLASEDFGRLRENSRQDVPAVIVEDGQTTYPDVMLHLKGSTGSFRGIDDKPAFTLKFGNPAGDGRFHGLRKVHLNNSVEDPSYFNEYAGSELFRAAGVPAPRVTHAVVTLNGRRLGLYVLKEGFTAEFLGQYFRDPHGNLYDTGPGHDVDEALERDGGTGPEDRSDLIALATAAREPDLATRWERVGRALDRDRFLAFMALEVLVGHRDGYCLARNNFRIYQDPATSRMVFLPHGMDQLFGRPDATIRPAMQGLVARAMVETPEGRRDFRARLAQLAREVLDVPRLRHQADAFFNRVWSSLEPRERQALKRELAATLERIALRRASVEEQLTRPEPRTLPFVNHRIALTDWQPTDLPAGGRMDRQPAPDGRSALHIRAGPVTSASWRTTAYLAKGRYRFRGVAVTRGVVALPFGNNHGAGLRVVGGSPSAPYELLGDQPGTPLERAFEVEVDRDVELICELRARAGEAWFVLDTLSLEAVP